VTADDRPVTDPTLVRHRNPGLLLDPVADRTVTAAVDRPFDLDGCVVAAAGASLDIYHPQYAGSGYVVCRFH